MDEGPPPSTARQTHALSEDRRKRRANASSREAYR